jgi:hypothetical protein
MKYFLTLLALVFLPAVTIAKTLPNDTQLKIAPTQLKTNKAYLLMRSSKAKSGLINLEHIFLRVPEVAENEAYYSAKKAAFEKELPRLMKQTEKDPKQYPMPTIEKFSFVYDGAQNIFSIDAGDFLEDGDERTFLVEVDPGTYILYGSGQRVLVTCNCLGTVKFGARAGVITNLGSLYLDKVHKPSDVPHLEDNLGKSMFAYQFILGQAVVPAALQSQVPQSLKPLPIALAEYEAVGPFIEPGAGGINRLAPIPGILGYDRGKVINLKTGQVVK